MPSSRFILVLKNPGINREIQGKISEALTHRRTLLIVGNCWVDYRGRASSKLEPGERIVIIKEDGSVMVHRPKGYEAANWQPPGCVINSTLRGEILEIKATRRKPLESLTIFFDRLFFLSILKLRDTGIFSLYASEEDMQKAILLKPSLIEEDFKPISFEKKVEPGFVDVYGIDQGGSFVVVEIKRKVAGRNAVLQLSKYVEAVRRTASREVKGVIAAPSIAKGTQKLIEELRLKFVPLDPRKCAELLQKKRVRKLTDFLEDPRLQDMAS